MTSNIKLGIVDDHKVLADSLSSFCAKEPDMEVLFVANSQEELMGKLRWDEQPNVILMDYALGSSDGEDCIIQLRKEYGQSIRVLGFSMHTDEGIIYKLIKAGANGYVSKLENASKIIEAIRTVHETGVYTNTSLSKMLLDKIQRTENKPVHQEDGFTSLSEIDLEILRLICQEQTNEQIAVELNLSVHTISTYRKKIQKKLGCKNTAGLVVFAVRNGIFR
jgi:DNA-binding NarL/FixJ family response regulator